jgi:NAD-dependent SIR2 family protein deacetylase
MGSKHTVECVQCGRKMRLDRGVEPHPGQQFICDRCEWKQEQEWAGRNYPDPWMRKETYRR